MLSLGTINTSVLPTKLRRDPAASSFCASARSIASWSAEANTSAGAPLAICASSASDAAKLKTTVVPGFCASKGGPSSRNAFVRLAAAETVRSAAWAATQHMARTAAPMPASRREGCMGSWSCSARRFGGVSIDQRNIPHCITPCPAATVSGLRSVGPALSVSNRRAATCRRSSRRSRPARPGPAPAPGSTPRASRACRPAGHPT